MPISLNRENYFSQQASIDYMSNSQYKDFLSCEAMALAKIKGEWIEEPSKEFLVGSYVHSWQEHRQREFISEHPEMFKKNGGGLLKEFVDADKMISTLENDPFVAYVLQGQKEVILSAEMFGCRWKIMIDSHNPELRRNVDLKTTRSIVDLVWDEEIWGKVSFVEKYKYVTQAAIYSEVERLAHGRPEEDWFNFYIVAVSKDDFPDKEVISMVDPLRYQQELTSIEGNMPRILAIKAGEVEPSGCGKCDYCHSIKQLSEAIHYKQLDPKFYGLG